MASNLGKCFDRSPIVCAAGKPTEQTSTVSDCLKDYRTVDEIDALKHDAGIFEEHRIPFKYKLPRIKNIRHRGVYTESQPVLQPPVKTRYQRMINDLKETSYDSYWHQLVGKCRDPIPGIPAGMDVEQTTFGRPSIKEMPAKLVVNPPKTVYQVLWDSQVGHEMYKNTHNDYNPAEHINRGYLEPPYNPNKRYGERTAYDPRGIWVRCACHWHNNNPVTSVSSIQADVLDRQTSRIGKVLEPCHNINSVPKEHMFGKPTKRGMYGMAELLRDPESPPCIFKRDFHKWMGYLNELRISLKKRFNEFDFDFREFEDHNLYYDKAHIGWVPLDLFYRLCGCHGVFYQYECLEPLFKFIGVIQDNMINYKHFVFLADINSSVPEIVKIEDVPKGCQYYISTAHGANCDFMKIDNSKMPMAGIPSIRFDLPRPSPPVGGCRADLENLGDETSAGTIINPSIYTNFGLSYRDFYMPRSPQMMRRIFEKIGYQFPDDTFEKLWEIGVGRDKTGLVCVDTFKKLINETVEPDKFIINKDDVC